MGLLSMVDIQAHSQGHPGQLPSPCLLSTVHENQSLPPGQRDDWGSACREGDREGAER